MAVVISAGILTKFRFFFFEPTLLIFFRSLPIGKQKWQERIPMTSLCNTPF